MFAKPLRDGKYMTIMDPFQIKYGNGPTAIQCLASLVVDITWVPSTLMGLGIINISLHIYQQYGSIQHMCYILRVMHMLHIIFTIKQHTPQLPLSLLGELAKIDAV